MLNNKVFDPKEDIHIDHEIRLIEHEIGDIYNLLRFYHLYEPSTKTNDRFNPRGYNLPLDDRLTKRWYHIWERLSKLYG